MARVKVQMSEDSYKMIAGKVLPKVTADDNGDVLTVVDGAWGKATPGGGGGGDSGVFCVHATIAPIQGTATITEDIGDIVSAVASEKIVFLLSEGDVFYMTVGDVSDPSAPYLEFSKMGMESQGSGQFTISETKVTYDTVWSSSFVTGTFSE